MTNVIKKLEILGEATKNIPKAIRDKQKGLPWTDMAKMRDKLSHEYLASGLISCGKSLWKNYPVSNRG